MRGCLSGLIDYTKKNGTRSCRKLAEIFGTTKSSVSRRQQKIKKRSEIPTASFFETVEGRQFLLRFVIASIFVFGIMSGIGSKRISLFFSLININSFVAVSSSSVDRIETQIDDLIIAYKDKYDAVIKAKVSELEITAGADETFFENLMLLVLMDLSSGYIFLEKAEAKRDHKTWEKNSLPWLSAFKSTRCFVSDKARALLKLAKVSFGVDRIADLFHMMNDVSKTMRYAFYRFKKRINKAVTRVQQQITKGIEVATNTVLLATLQSELKALSVAQITYQHHQRRLSTSLHPFSILSSNRQSSANVEKNMQSSLSKIITIKDKFEIPDPQKRLNRTKRQIPDAAKQIDLWWQWVETSVESEEIAPEVKDWLLHYLLPLIYWRSQLKKTRSKYIKRFYRLSIQNAQRKLDAHQLTARHMPNGEEKDSQWIAWAKQMTNIFLRTTSAVEGRNGWLSQIHFNGRGLSEKRIKSQTAIHNYFLKRDDGSTACERLTGEKPDDIFEYIMNNIGPLAEPRKYKTQNNAIPSILKSVPA